MGANRYTQLHEAKIQGVRSVLATRKPATLPRPPMPLLMRWAMWNRAQTGIVENLRALSSTNTLPMMARASTGTPARLAVKALCQNGSARCTSPAASTIGSRSRTEQRRQ
jgi:hypothetical protein